ncbi:hypothetical protein Acr_26g0004630 [Actinidia rufa]|uniref:Uncharacterized protein n=1 Tax=Actinidia rufa TaxID=165716 RepID=A0A7J0H260_9ERIC|nr:hypothetical protein Acr_26g0004630 [Actinidia rufa]
MLREGVDEMGCAMVNNTLHLCRRGLQEAGETEHLDAALAYAEIAFRELGHTIRDAGPFTSIPSPSKSWDNDKDHHRVWVVKIPPRAPLAAPRDGVIGKCY